MQKKNNANAQMKNKASLPPGLVPYTGPRKNFKHLKEWLRDEPDSLASRGPHLRFRHPATTK
jgi:hypothetical protein